MLTSYLRGPGAYRAAWADRYEESGAYGHAYEGDIRVWFFPRSHIVDGTRIQSTSGAFILDIRRYSTSLHPIKFETSCGDQQRFASWTLMMQPLTAKLGVWYVIWRHWPSRGVPAAAFNCKRCLALLEARNYIVQSVERGSVSM